MIRQQRNAESVKVRGLKSLAFITIRMLHQSETSDSVLGRYAVPPESPRRARVSG